MLVAHPGNILSLDAAKVSYIASTVRFSIGVDQLTIETRLGYAEAVIVTHYWRRIHHECHDVAIVRLSEERNDAVIRVMKIDPIKSFVGIVELPERRFAFVNII